MPMQIDIEEFYNNYAHIVIKRCRAILKHEQQAFDAAQDVFVKLLMMKDKTMIDNPITYLYRMATNVCLNMIKKSKRELQPAFDMDSLPATRIADSYKGIEDHETITMIFRNTNESIRDIAYMYYLDGMSMKEIAKIQNVSVPRIHQLLEKFRRNAKNLQEGGALG